MQGREILNEKWQSEYENLALLKCFGICGTRLARFVVTDTDALLNTVDFEANDIEAGSM